MDCEGAEAAGSAPENEPARQYFYIERARRHLARQEAIAGRRLTFCVRTFGCQMNARDSEKLCGILREVGYERREDEDADFVLYNTCAVRERADNKIYGRLGCLSGIKKKNPLMRVALCGCMAQEAQTVERIRKSYPFVDLIFGTRNIDRFAELLVSMYEQSDMVVDIREGEIHIVEGLPDERKYPFKSGVNIMFGCDNFCSYCIVPHVRGRERSREPDEIIREIERFAADGVVEVMLLGQNVNSYGKNLEGSVTFARLLERVEAVDGISRIRFMTSHPKDFSDELIRVMERSEKICSHLHLPLQSGSSRVLGRMNRHYTKEAYLALAEKVRAAVPGIALTTDIIVGFPGETEGDFEETMDVVRRVRFEGAFTFIYSKREGTPAAGMGNQVPEDIIKRRFDRLLAEVRSTAAQRAEALVGRTMDVLVESANRRDSGLVSGRLSNNQIVHLPGDESLIGRIVPVRLDICKGFYYYGTSLS